MAEVAGQVKNVAQWFYYYAGLADKVEGSVVPINKTDVFNYVKWEPLGVVVAITPWNSPLALTTWKMAPALAAGNTLVIKPSEYTFTINGAGQVPRDYQAKRDPKVPRGNKVRAIFPSNPITIRVAAPSPKSP